jgi:hypothetical protein
MNTPEIKTYKGFKVLSRHIGDEKYQATAKRGQLVLTSKRFSGSSGRRRAEAHCRRQIEALDS